MESTNPHGQLHSINSMYKLKQFAENAAHVLRHYNQLIWNKIQYEAWIQYWIMVHIHFLRVSRIYQEDEITVCTCTYIIDFLTLIYKLEYLSL